MKKRFWSTLLVLGVILTASILLVGCNTKEEQTEIINPIKVTISITYPKEAKLDNIVKEQVKVEENSTINDVLQLYCNVSNISTNMDTTSSTITSIASVSNGDFNDKSTWQYKLNGEICDEPADEKIISEGDEIEWVYQK